MMELARHIESLLLDNDCVIIPGLGGFIAHYTSSSRIEEESIFLPPTRTIGFNPQLRLNDGLLVQSYMSVYNTSFSDANKMVECKVKELTTALHEDGKINLLNIGEIHCTLHNTYNFSPYNQKITSPSLYGLDAFEMQELSVLEEQEAKKQTPIPFQITKENKRPLNITVKPAYWTSVAATIAAIVLFFFFSTPIENTEIMDENYAKMLPNELFEKIEKESLVINPIRIKQPIQDAKATQAANKKESSQKTVAPIIAKEVKVKSAEKNISQVETLSNHSDITQTTQKDKQEANTPLQTSTTQKSYHIIIASVGSEKDATEMASQLIKSGFADAKAILGDGKRRVSIASYLTHKEASQALNHIRQDEKYQGAWVLKKQTLTPQ